MRLRILILFTILFNAKPGLGQRDLSLFDTLYAEKEIKITLTYHFDSLYRANQGDIDAAITIETNNGILMDNAPLSLSLRGKFRRMRCDMPPILLNFKKSHLRALNLNEVDEIKLVTHCIPGEEGQKNLEEERLCYQLYEALTPYAYRTIWIKIEYRDLSNPGHSLHSAAFLLEPDKVISARFGFTEKRIFNVAEDSLHYESYALASAFNFLIGNRDWSVVAARNAKLFFEEKQSVFYVIPYDFDFANIVAASYRREARPKTMKHVFDRVYEGEYFHSRSADILANFLERQASLLQMLESAHNPMDPEKRNKIRHYFEHWFSFIKKRPASELQFGLVCPYKGTL